MSLSSQYTHWIIICRSWDESKRIAVIPSRNILKYNFTFFVFSEYELIPKINLESYMWVCIKSALLANGEEKEQCCQILSHPYQKNHQQCTKQWAVIERKKWTRECKKGKKNLSFLCACIRLLLVDKNTFSQNYFRFLFFGHFLCKWIIWNCFVILFLYSVCWVVLLFLVDW